MIARVKKLVSPSHGACKLFRAWITISPKEGEPGGSPKPRKSKAVRAVIAPHKLNGKKVMVATVALGSICLNIITAFDTPNALAARI